MDEDEDAVAVERAADADVVQPPGVTQGDGAFVDLVGAHPGVGSGCGFVWWRGFGSGFVSRGGCAAVQGAVGSLVVVLVLEAVEQGLQQSPPAHHTALMFEGARPGCGRPDGPGYPAVLDATVVGLIAAKRSGDDSDDEDTRDDHHGGLQA
ncbi:hypothetical protein AWH69_05065 [Janibacter melonis]|uniref:Uncharacterized protein n=1 Tax=Janibacter melonis TaxID=262209 RepID=A0A176QCP8_9MICO|nr:hypothetical protein AWH69_05065 [Janibacter melonis]